MRLVTQLFSESKTKSYKIPVSVHSLETAVALWKKGTRQRSNCYSYWNVCKILIIIVSHPLVWLIDYCHWTLDILLIISEYFANFTSTNTHNEMHSASFGLQNFSYFHHIKPILKRPHPVLRDHQTSLLWWSYVSQRPSFIKKWIPYSSISSKLDMHVIFRHFLDLSWLTLLLIDHVVDVNATKGRRDWILF